jgi:hypothetical protein
VDISYTNPQQKSTAFFKILRVQNIKHHLLLFKRCIRARNTSDHTNFIVIFKPNVGEFRKIMHLLHQLGQKKIHTRLNRSYLHRGYMLLLSFSSVDVNPNNLSIPSHKQSIRATLYLSLLPSLDLESIESISITNVRAK